MRQSLKIHYDEIIVEGDDQMKPNIPLLIASTHPNSFLDAIILGSVIDRPLYFLARSDVFNKKWSDYILRKLNLIPIYRLQEGHNNLIKNDETFESCFEILEQKGAVLIFAEGISLIDKKVRKPKKGLARIGFGAEAKNNFNLNIEILPVGINYESAAQMRNRILVQFEQAIPLNQFQNEFQKNANASYQTVNNKLFKGLKEASILAEDEHIYDFIAKNKTNETYTFSTLKTLSQKIHELRETDSIKYAELSDRIKKLMELEKQNGFDSKFLRYKSKPILRILICIPALFGYLINIPPLFLANYIANKKVKLIEFFASVKLVLGTILWLLWALVIFLLGCSNAILEGLSFVLILLLFGKIYLQFQRLFRIAKNKRKYKRFTASKDFGSYQESIQFIQRLFPNTIQG